MKDFLYASESCKKRNPHYFGVGGLPTHISQPNAGATLERVPQRTEESGKSVGRRHWKPRITITHYTHRLMDSHDNLRAGYKHLVDQIAAWLGMDDAEINWEYGQVETKGQQGTSVRIET